MDDVDTILTSSQAARILGVSTTTVQNWIESGMLPSWKTPGGHRRVRRSSVVKLLKEPATQIAAMVKMPVPAAQPDGEFVCPDKPYYVVPLNEQARLKSVFDLNLVGTARNAAFDRLTWLAKEFTGTSMALITLLTARRQWFLSRWGVDIQETPREWAFCSRAILQDDIFVVEDALQDEHFRNNPLVTQPPYLRFYAGVPLIEAQGFRVGTLCVLDQVPRKLREQDVGVLRELGALASEELQRAGQIRAK